MIVKVNKAKGKIEKMTILFPKVLKVLLMLEQTMNLNLISFLQDQKLTEVEIVVVMIEVFADELVKIKILEEVAEVAEDKNLRNKMTMKILYSLRLPRMISRMRMILLLLAMILSQL